MNLQDQNAIQNQNTAPYRLTSLLFPNPRYLLYQWGYITTDGRALLSFQISHQRRYEKYHLSRTSICTIEQIAGGLVPLTFNFSVTKVRRAYIGPKTGLVGLALVLTPPNDPQVGGRGYK